MKLAMRFQHGQWYAIVHGSEVARLKGTKPRRPWARYRGCIASMGPTPEAAAADAFRLVAALRRVVVRERVGQA